MTYGDHIPRTDAASLLAALDPDLRRQAQARVNRAVACFLGKTLAGDPPLQHATPVLAVARALAGLVLLLGDPALIELVADESRRALHDGSLTTHDLLGTQFP